MSKTKELQREIRRLRKQLKARQACNRVSLEAITRQATRALARYFNLKQVRPPNLMLFSDETAEKENMEPGDAGGYAKPNRIFLNQRYIGSLKARECLGLISHEVAHYLHDRIQPSIKEDADVIENDLPERRALINLQELVAGLSELFYVWNYGTRRSHRTLIRELNPKDMSRPSYPEEYLNYYWGYKIAKHIFIGEDDPRIIGKIARCKTWRQAYFRYQDYIDVMPDFESDHPQLPDPS